eukprot:TRINITY_DN64008_c0_g1_i1.p1 TRINITY_DN64008_c0_g1~~TRINITY_DN64008_c0_g1_i1.p1  ORF type:complete len:850 (+),score=179.98 TRINITY_DN64008_c0_g1_i1:156-2705(+)
MSDCPVKICEQRITNGILEIGSGSIVTGLPWFKNHGENEWNNGLRGVLYLLGLFWLFMGVNIAADVFMGAIERITSQKKRVFQKSTGRLATVKVWNDTVANLTLMALGSSAPEILLSIIELLTADPFYTSGALGPSTIVGSAAFNLFCISAVCVVAIPNGEVRMIHETTVFAVTATFSVFAYIWLLIIVSWSSKNYISIWEGIASSLLFPLLVVLAFMADKGYFSKDGSAHEGKVCVADLTAEEIASIELKAMQVHGQDLTDEQLAQLIERDNAAPRSRAQYRVAANRHVTGGKRVTEPLGSTHNHPQLTAVVPVVEECDDSVGGKKYTEVEDGPAVSFVASHFAVLESVGVVNLQVVLDKTSDDVVLVDYKTQDGTAKAGSDFKPVEATLEFQPGETAKHVQVHIIDDTAYEDDEEFFVNLSNPRAQQGKAQPRLGTFPQVRVDIVDDDEPGILCFDVDKDQDCMNVEEDCEAKTILIPVKRKMGSSGVVTVKYETESHTAIKGKDFEHTEGVLTFESGQISATVSVVIIPRGRYESREEFRVLLSEPTGGAKLDSKRDGGPEMNIMTIVIEPDTSIKNRVDRVMEVLRYDHDRASVGFSNYADQLQSALYINGGEDEDGEPPSYFDCAMHIITFFWKVLFALVPPADFCGGWLCFGCSLIGIGVLTAFISDMASMVGCVFGMPDSVTAVTLVALGTSLPDTFASKSAAEQDPYADASIGNITGSNSVNVFLGLGLPWMVGAFYWAGAGRTEEWQQMYSSLDNFDELNQGIGKFVVQGGSDLGFCVLVFSILAILAIALLVARRKLFGGELGGPAVAKYATAAILVFMWLIFIVLFVIQVLVINPSAC